MVASLTPPSVATVGNLLVLFVPGTAGTAGTPASVATLTANTTKDVTFSFIASGLTPTINENSVADGRLGQRQILNQPGNYSETLELEYTYGTAADVARVALARGTYGYLVWRYGIPNETAPATGQFAHIYTILTGIQQPQAPAENSILTMKQMCYIQAPTQYATALTA